MMNHISDRKNLESYSRKSCKSHTRNDKQISRFRLTCHPSPGYSADYYATSVYQIVLREKESSATFSKSTEKKWFPLDSWYEYPWGVLALTGIVLNPDQQMSSTLPVQMLVFLKLIPWTMRWEKKLGNGTTLTENNRHPSTLSKDSSPWQILMSHFFEDYISIFLHVNYIHTIPPNYWITKNQFTVGLLKYHTMYPLTSCT